MPHSTTSYLDAFDRQGTITECLSSVIQLIARSDKGDFSLVDRADFSLLLYFLNEELIARNSFSALVRSENDSKDLFINCYNAISDLTDPCKDLHQVSRDNLFFILNFLHEEMKRINTVIHHLNQSSDDLVSFDEKGQIIISDIVNDSPEPKPHSIAI